MTLCLAMNATSFSLHPSLVTTSQREAGTLSPEVRRFVARRDGGGVAAAAAAAAAAAVGSRQSLWSHRRPRPAYPPLIVMISIVKTRTEPPGILGGEPRSPYASSDGM